MEKRFKQKYNLIILTITTLIIVTGCTKFEKQPDFYLDNSLKKISRMQSIDTVLFVGNKDYNYLFDKSKFIAKENYTTLDKDAILKLFIKHYNLVHNTNYNVMINIGISDNTSILLPVFRYEITGLLLEIKE